jgi:hypothetical protein
MRHPILVAAALLAASLPALATVFATVHGVVHDPEHRPIAGAKVTLQPADSAFVLHGTTNGDGEFELPAAPIGVYRLMVEAAGFNTETQTISLASGTNPVLHFMLSVGGVTQSVVVNGAPSAADTATPTVLITRQMIDETPGADRTIGTEMITDYVPGAYMTHDMLHMRGGHQTSWLIDGVAIPNTKIASNVGPQIDPKDIDSLETLSGSYDADLGDRTYGMFNVLPRNGFAFNREGELMLYAGSLSTGEAQVALGDHSEKSAWYASATGSRTNYGLATPVAAIYHDATNSESGFVSLLRNETPKDQLRVNGQLREDFFQVPYDPSQTDYECASTYYCSWGLRDGQTERDAFLIANWVHTFSAKALISAAQFYHFNQADYDSRITDDPVATTWHQQSNYGGAQADARLDTGWNSFSGGLYSFFQSEDDLFGVTDNTTHPLAIYSNAAATDNAGLVEFYVGDHLRLGQYVTLLGGERFSIYRAQLDEGATYPRIGATVRIPKLNWVLRGFYGHFFQPAPILTVSVSVLNFAASLPNTEENAFAPIPSERDEERQFGIEIPYRGWMLNVDTFKNRVNNFLDHSNLGESNMYFPIAVDGALVRSWEMTLHSPQLWQRGQFYVTYSNQIAEQRGNIIGGFICDNGNPADPIANTSCDLGPQYIALDHDQRETLNTGFTAKLPLHTWFATNVYYGSGFSNGLACSVPSSCPNDNGPYLGPYLPVHTTFDSSLGHAIGERWKLSVTAINVTNHRVLQDNSITIGGFHYNDPRMIAAEVKYRFHF